ncbi:ATP-binding cassette domain-containing protein [Caldinitratiruptor microaerophilus]|uniref:ABC transporter domain-containing protein n=1 Tax=Caldinitratiruptor microaerophilus TaxID=671077 RepID=A0AA35CNQ4_9FIRM|nr:ATP-binding cassette domain-containing protein [Caldinitratiruptor microaerophilus]BDG60731.1 hypothetical protein caldi_18210 [Caldinitratiruptor microaerophilus]
MTKWALRAFGLTKQHAGRPVLRGVNLSLAAGEVLAITGAPGAGKSLLLSVLATATRADAGSFYVDGWPVLAWPGHRPRLREVRRRIGYLPERTGHLPGLTGWESGLLFARLFGLDPGAARRRLGDLFERLDLLGVAGQPVATYSLSERRRLALAEALLHQPSLLLLDRPDDGHAASVRAHIADVLQAEARRGRAILLALRDGDAAPELALLGRRAVLAGGLLS